MVKKGAHAGGRKSARGTAMTTASRCLAARLSEGLTVGSSPPNAVTVTAGLTAHDQLPNINALADKSLPDRVGLGTSVEALHHGFDPCTEAMHRAIPSIKVRTVKDSGDSTTEQVVEVKLRGKTRALTLAARAGMLTDLLDVTTSEDRWRGWTATSCATAASNHNHAAHTSSDSWRST